MTGPKRLLQREIIQVGIINRLNGRNGDKLIIIIITNLNNTLLSFLSYEAAFSTFEMVDLRVPFNFYWQNDRTS